MVQFFLKKLKEVSEFYKNIKFGTIKKNENILIYGISRGGTTMLAEALNSVLDSRLVWEPLFPHRNVSLSKINPYSIHNYKELDLGWNPSIIHPAPKADLYFKKLFALKERNIRLFRFTNKKRFSKQEYTIFKFCFGNFMYPYFQDNFNGKSLILIRHPFAVAASSLNFGKNYNWHKKNWSEWSYKENNFNKGFFDYYNSKLDLINSPFTLIVFQAVSQFSYILDNYNKNTTKVIFYEDLIVSPNLVLQEVEGLIGNKLDQKTFLQSISKGSFSSREGHTLKDSRKQLSKWKKICSSKDIEDGLKIFEAFNFNYYSENLEPVKS